MRIKYGHTVPTVPTVQVSHDISAPPPRMSPGGENILSLRLEYSFPRREYSSRGEKIFFPSPTPRVERLPPIEREKVSPHDTKDVLKGNLI